MTRGNSEGILSPSVHSSHIYMTGWGHCSKQDKDDSQTNNGLTEVHGEGDSSPRLDISTSVSVERKSAAPTAESVVHAGALAASGCSTNTMQDITISNSRRIDSGTKPVFAGQMYQASGWNNTPLFRNRVPCSTKPQDGSAKEQVEQVEQGNYVSANKETNCNSCSRDEGNVFTLFQLFRGGRRDSRNAIIWNRAPCSTLFHSTPIGEVIAW